MLYLSRFTALLVIGLNLTACVHTTGDSVQDDAKLRATDSMSRGSKTSKVAANTADDDLYVDPLPALGPGKDDFSDIEQRAAAYEKAAHEESEDARIERELREIHATEAKTRAELEKREAIERAEAHKQARAAAAQAAVENKQKVREARERAKKLPSIDQDDLEWHGLEDK